MWQPTVRLHRGGEGLMFRSAFIRSLTITCRLTGHSCNDKWIVCAPEEMASAKITAGSNFHVAPEKLVSPQWTHKHAISNLRGRDLLDPNLRGKGITKGYTQHTT